MEYLRSKALTQDESNKIEGEITMAELEFALFKKMKGSSAPGIDGFQVNWLRKFWASFKLVTFYAIHSLPLSRKSGFCPEFGQTAKTARFLSRKIGNFQYPLNSRKIKGV